MFDKEAEEYVIKKHNIDISKQPIDFSLKCEFSEDLTDFRKGAEFGYNKANEWHYVKDGDLPLIINEGRWLIVMLDDKRMETYWWNAKTVPQRVIENFKKSVIAWKEIVLPKERE